MTEIDGEFFPFPGIDLVAFRRTRLPGRSILGRNKEAFAPIRNDAVACFDSGVSVKHPNQAFVPLIKGPLKHMFADL